MTTHVMTGSNEKKPTRRRNASATPESPVQTVADMIRFLEPGKRYAAKSVARKLNLTQTAADNLLFCAVQNSKILCWSPLHRNVEASIAQYDPRTRVKHRALTDARCTVRA